MNEINKALAKLDGWEYVYWDWADDEGRSHDEEEWKVDGAGTNEDPPDYCFDIKATIKLAIKLGIIHREIYMKGTMIRIKFIRKMVTTLKIDISEYKDSYSAEAYARAALLLECCVLEGLING